MANKLFKYNLTFILIVVLFCGLVSPVLAAQDTGLTTAANKAFGGADKIPFKDAGGIPGIVGILIGVVLSLVGILFLLLMIYGGILWMTARGNDQQVEKAKDLIIASIIGLVIVLGAYAITDFIGGIIS